MQSSLLDHLSVDPGPAGAAIVYRALAQVLEGRRRPFVPIPNHPARYGDQLAATVRPDDSAAPLEFDDVAICVMTAGSSGTPRGVLLAGEALTAAACASDEHFGGSAHWLLALPVHHIGGLQVLVRSHLAGSEPTVLQSVGGAARFDTDAFTAAATEALQIARSRGLPMRTALVPTQVCRLFDSGSRCVDALREFQAVLVGGAAMPADLRARTDTAGIRVVETYGMTETAGGCVYEGGPLTGATAAIRDPDQSGVGPIELSGTMVALGYRLAPEATAEVFAPGRFATSDLGRMVDGQLRVCGRLDDVVQVGGVNVSLRAVEELALCRPGIDQAAAIATPDERWGSRIVLFVAREQRGSPSKTEAITELERTLITVIGEGLGPEARPRRVIALTKLPLLATGKIDRMSLHRIASAAVVTSGTG